MPNFGSNFLRGFGTTFPNTFNTSFRYGLQQQEDEAVKQKALEYDKKQQDILSTLIKGSTPLEVRGVRLQRPLSQDEIWQGYAKLSPQNQNTFEFITKQREAELKKNEPDYYAPQLGKAPTIKLFNKKTNRLEDTGQPDPFYKEEEIKPTFVEKGYVGNKEVRREFYKQPDGTYKTVDIPTGFLKETKEGKDTFYLNPQDFKKKLSLYEAKYASLKVKIQALNNLKGNDAVAKANQINKDMDVLEQEFYDELLPEAEGEINKYYTEIKKRVGGDIPTDFEYTNREKLREGFKSDITAKYKSGGLVGDLSYIKDYKGMQPDQQRQLREEINGQNLRSLLLWADLKFHRQ